MAEFYYVALAGLAWHLIHSLRMTFIAQYLFFFSFLSDSMGITTPAINKIIIC